MKHLLHHPFMQVIGASLLSFFISDVVVKLLETFYRHSLTNIDLYSSLLVSLVAFSSFFVFLFFINFFVLLKLKFGRKAFFISLFSALGLLLVVLKDSPSPIFWNFRILFYLLFNAYIYLLIVARGFKRILVILCGVAIACTILLQAQNIHKEIKIKGDTYDKNEIRKAQIQPYVLKKPFKNLKLETFTFDNTYEPTGYIFMTYSNDIFLYQYKYSPEFESDQECLPKWPQDSLVLINNCPSIGTTTNGTNVHRANREDLTQYFYAELEGTVVVVEDGLFNFSDEEAKDLYDSLEKITVDDLYSLKISN